MSLRSLFLPGNKVLKEEEIILQPESYQIDNELITDAPWITCISLKAVIDTVKLRVGMNKIDLRVSFTVYELNGDATKYIPFKYSIVTFWRPQADRREIFYEIKGVLK